MAAADRLSHSHDKRYQATTNLRAPRALCREPTRHSREEPAPYPDTGEAFA